MSAAGSQGRLEAELERYGELVTYWSARVDLVSDRDLTRFHERHVADSLRLLPLVRDLAPGLAVDVGSGAGLPGIPLALAERTVRWRLLEPRSRRAAFLEEASRELQLDCEVLRLTAEQAHRDPRLARAHALATVRAVAPPEAAFTLATPLVAPGGFAAVFVGEAAVPLPPQTEEFAPGIAILRGRPRPEEEETG